MYGAASTDLDLGYGRRVERVLSQRELNRALLARQLLLERGRTTLPRSLERIGGIQAQYAPSMYVGLWSRLDGLEREALTRALERRVVVQATLLRATIHLVSRPTTGRSPWRSASRRRAWWLRVNRITDDRPLRIAARKLRRALADGPLPWKEIQQLLGEQARGVGLFLDLVRVPPSGTWERRRADLYAAAEDWVGPEDVGEREARDLVVRRYLSGFGPARAGEIGDWAGLDMKDLAPSLERLDLRRFRDEEGKELLDLPRAPLPDPDTPVPPRFLPTWDATLLVHARGTQILPEQYRSRIFSTKAPNSFPHVPGRRRRSRGRGATRKAGSRSRRSIGSTRGRSASGGEAEPRKSGRRRACPRRLGAPDLAGAAEDLADVRVERQRTGEPRVRVEAHQRVGAEVAQPDDVRVVDVDRVGLRLRAGQAPLAPAPRRRVVPAEACRRPTR